MCINSGNNIQFTYFELVFKVPGDCLQKQVIRFRFQDFQTIVLESKFLFFSYDSCATDTFDESYYPVRTRVEVVEVREGLHFAEDMLENGVFREPFWDRSHIFR